jgi:hypothetical protein
VCAYNKNGGEHECKQNLKGEGDLLKNGDLKIEKEMGGKH